ncbi:MAG: sigma-54-dependent Fis family transcriptional regulator [Deltaproteobacteria bacterium]|nr:sigma-54-dependent Fis family transcriptional regulator [Deltaproteobacteria bacterium]
MKAKILVVDDESAIRKALSKFLTTLDYDVDSAGDGAEAIEKAKDKIYDLVISDLMMPNMSGIELIAKLKEMHPNIISIIMTGFGTIESAVEAIKAGAFHYITKPFELDDVAMLVEKALRFKSLEADNARLAKQVKDKYNFENIVGCSDALRDVFKMVERVAETDSNVLILGESGTGKELIARAIHFNSPRQNKPLIPINCGAIPENLLETELFGYVKGAFTGASHSQVGKFEVANGGTIFLDEIGDMSLKLQVKLLRVLQEKQFEPVGSTKTIRADVRVIAATHQNLEELVAKGEFREDLFYRLNVIPITVPSLRDRISDVPLLVDHFIKKFTQANQLATPDINDEVMNALMSYKWPGNVRELENTIERLVVLRPGQHVRLSDLPDKFSEMTNSFFIKSGFSFPESGISLKHVVEDFENTLICKALDKTGWNKNQAANLLKLNRTTLVEKIKKKKLSKPKKVERIKLASVHPLRPHS